MLPRSRSRSCCARRGLAGGKRDRQAGRSRRRRWPPGGRAAAGVFAAALRKLGGAHFHATLALSASGAPGGAPTRGHDHHRRLARPYGQLPIARGKRSRRRPRGRPLRARARRCATLWEDDPPRRRGARAEPVAGRGAGRALGGVRARRARMARVDARRDSELVGGARDQLHAVDCGDATAAEPPAPALPLAGLRSLARQRVDRDAVGPRWSSTTPPARWWRPI